MTWIVFSIYLLLFCWLVAVLPFFRRSGLGRKILVGLFLVKIAAGIAYFQFYSLPQNKPESDTWRFYTESINETGIILKDPGLFTRDIFQSSYDETGGLFSDQHSHWNDLKDRLVVKLMAVINVFTGKNYYTNLLFFNFFFFFGLVAFYRLMNGIYPGRKLVLVIVVFLLPSVLFWCSGIHKDGLVFSALGLIFYCFHQILTGRRSRAYLFTIVACMILVFFLRNYLLFLLLCALLAGWLVHRFPARKWQVLLTLFILGGILTFTAKYIHPSLDIAGYIAEKQAQFSTIEGDSKLPTPSLESDVSSFAAALPFAVDAAMLRPHLGEKGFASLVAAVEILVFWCAFLFCLIYRRKDISHPPVVWACLIFAILALLVIGYTVPFSGAIVRYRALLLPLLLAPAVGAVQHMIKKYI